MFPTPNTGPPLMPPTLARSSYAKEMLGHHSIQVTVDTYGHLIPGADVAGVDKLDSQPNQQPAATQAQPEEILKDEKLPQLLENSGEPGRTRTYNPLIKSQLLYH
jgi:hypothetical protein